ncbi:unnamed protein product [Allacma fusca]|uniref:Glutathione peroxidase n=1 Tax=Allacma fusca TaxID=39272 RepID=A0A8J2K0C6_9HEXA|nr:unnamed protein product [Allacma fusca]
MIFGHLRQYSKILAAAAGGTFTLGVAGGVFKKHVGDSDWKNAKSIYDFSYIDIDGHPQSMKQFKDCVLFGQQEPGTNEQIKEFVSQYNVQFHLASKIDVNGVNTHPLYNWLKSKTGGIFGSDIKWNFAKFLIDKHGQVYKRFSPNDVPFVMEPDILYLLKQPL